MSSLSIPNAVECLLRGRFGPESKVGESVRASFTRLGSVACRVV